MAENHQPPEPPPPYCGVILTGAYSDALKARIRECIAQFDAFERLGTPGIRYISAWRDGENIIWYEYVSRHLLELLDCPAEKAAEAFRNCLQHRRVYRYLDMKPGVKKEIQFSDALRNLRSGLRKESRVKGIVEAVYQLAVAGGRFVWLKDQASVETFESDRTCLSLGCLTDVTKEMEAEEELNQAQSALQQYAEELRRANAIQEQNSRQLADANERLEHAIDAAESANRAKSEFLAMVSHEIRTPMNAILGLTEFALQSGCSPEVQGCLDDVLGSGRHLLSIINDILDFSKIEAGKLDLQAAEFDLAAEIRAAIRPLAITADHKGLRLQLDIASPMPAAVVGDPDRFRQILTNLVGNAVRYTDRGKIHVALEHLQKPPLQHPSGEPGGEWLAFTLTVTDTGIGIPEDQIASIFDHFHQVQMSHHGRRGGTGLGLAICRRLVAAMGGDIRVQSRVGEGSRFECRFLMRKGSRASVARIDRQPIPSDALSQRTLTILLVEDTEINIKVSELFLNKFGHRVETAVNGQQALEMLSKNRFDLVLMDVEMPLVDGVQVTRRLRSGQVGECNRHVPVIATTAHAFDEARKNCLAAGMNAFISKPIDFERLQTLIVQLVGVKSGGGGRQSAIETTTVRSSSGKAPSLDAQGALKRLGGDREVLDKVMTVFRENIGPLCHQFEQAAEAADWESIRRLSHALKGSAGIVGAEACRWMAAELERCAKAGHGQRCQGLTGELLAELTRLDDTMKTMGEDGDHPDTPRSVPDDCPPPPETVS
jgi:signal transduction histidine kinase/FixJ family two-component response regulator/HPt (histidine-containing phosphotransfer) domain-containing protein